MLIKIETFTLSVDINHAQEFQKILNSNYISVLDMDGRFGKMKFLCETSAEQHEQLLKILDKLDYEVYCRIT